MNDNFINPTKLAYDSVLKELEDTKSELKQQVENLKIISDNLSNASLQNNSDQIVQTKENIISMDSILTDNEPSKEQMIAEMQSLSSKPAYELLSTPEVIKATMIDSSVKVMNMSSLDLINISKQNPVETVRKLV